MQLLEKELMQGARDVDGDVSDYTDIESDDLMIHVHVHDAFIRFMKTVEKRKTSNPSCRLRTLENSNWIHGIGTRITCLLDKSGILGAHHFVPLKRIKGHECSVCIGNKWFQTFP
jgi:hypothetical protein